MGKYILLFILTFSQISLFSVNAQEVDWRFSIEYNEIGRWKQPHHEQLLTKLARITKLGSINVNRVAGG